MSIQVVGIRVDYRDQPLAQDNRYPGLSWRLEPDRRSVRQSAFRILVASSEAGLLAGAGDLWDSGKQSGSHSIGIVYGGLALVSRQRCWWNVQVWDEHDQPSAPSAPASWEMGLL